jgi:hypothetical protein
VKFKLLILLFLVAGLVMPRAFVFAEIIDTDGDGLSDSDELLYRTDANNYDTDGDRYGDGEEVQHDYDPNEDSNTILQRHIEISILSQSLTYFVGPYEMKTIKISSGVKRTPTPKGNFTVLDKLPRVNYKGVGYNYPNTKWNLKFKYSKPGNYYIHGAYWHNNFGRPMSHGCINVSYADMEALYNWAKVGTAININ